MKGRDITSMWAANALQLMLIVTSLPGADGAPRPAPHLYVGAQQNNVGSEAPTVGVSAVD